MKRLCFAPLLAATAIAPLACRHVSNSAPQLDATPAPQAARGPEAARGPACLRVSTCGRWEGCVMARPQSLPFSISPGEQQITTGEWYRFDRPERPNQFGELRQICVGDAGPCFEGLGEVVACLPYFNHVAADYHCAIIDGVCTKVAERAP